jgi:hypothetical protein
MWALAFAIYVACKLLTWLDAAPQHARLRRSAAYLLAWPGMDARTFLDEARPARPTTPGEWLFAVGKFALGVGLVAISLSPALSPWLQAWAGMGGLVFLLHFGLFHLLSCLWRSLGIEAAPIMNWPIASASPSEFWSRRWNLAFRDLTHRYLFRPLTRRVGTLGALWLGFLVSGLVHDLVISLPARDGYGGPALFFLAQAAAISLERSRWGKSLGLNRGVVGWLFTLAVLLLPAPLLFHRPFQDNVVLPFLAAIGSLFGN